VSPQKRSKKTGPGRTQRETPRKRGQSRGPVHTRTQPSDSPLVGLPEEFWHNALSSGNFHNCALSPSGIPLYANEFLELCRKAGLLTAENNGFEKRFLTQLKSLYASFLPLILENSRKQLPLKFGSYSEYCAYFLPYLYMNASSEIASNLAVEKTDNYRAFMLEDSKMSNDSIELSLSYWIPDMDLDELDEEDPNSIKNIRNSLVYLSDHHLPENYQRVPTNRTRNRGVLGLCFSGEEVKKPKNQRGGRGKGNDRNSVEKKQRRDLEAQNETLLKPSAQYPYLYRKMLAKVVLLNNDQNRAFYQLARGTRIYFSVLNSLSQAMKQLETLREMRDNALFNKYFLSPLPETFSLPLDNVYLEGHGLNRKQFHAVSAASHVTGSREPEMLMIQGPPGTGKTHTIVSIVKTHLREWELKRKSSNKQPKPRKSVIIDDESDDNSADDDDEEPSVLICAPSNIAVDVIGRRLVEEGLDILRIGMLRKTSDDLRRCHIKQISLLSDTHKKRLFQDSRIILSTLNSSQPIYRSDRNFSLVIIDEAAQCAEPEIIMPMIYRPKTVILVGDHLQLPPTVKSRDAENSGYARSLFERFQSITAGRNMILLTEQYRMKPEICSMPSKIFYKNQLTSLEQNGRNPYIKLPPLACFDVTDSREESPPQSTSKYNLIEKDFIIKILESILSRVQNFTVDLPEMSSDSDDSDNDSSGSSSNSVSVSVRDETRKKRDYLRKIKIGIICFYADQVRVLENEIARRFGRDLIDVKTVDSFQGQERDIIIVSCCRANERQDIGFLRLDNRANVAVTRAKSSLIVVCNGNTFGKNPMWNKMFAHFRSKKAMHKVKSTTQMNSLDSILAN